MWYLELGFCLWKHIAHVYGAIMYTCPINMFLHLILARSLDVLLCLNKIHIQFLWGFCYFYFYFFSDLLILLRSQKNGIWYVLFELLLPAISVNQSCISCFYKTIFWGKSQILDPMTLIVLEEWYPCLLDTTIFIPIVLHYDVRSTIYSGVLIIYFCGA